MEICANVGPWAPEGNQGPCGRRGMNLILNRASQSGKTDCHHTLVPATPGHWLCAVIDPTYNPYGTQQSLPKTPTVHTVHSSRYPQSLMIHSQQLLPTVPQGTHSIYRWKTQAGNGKGDFLKKLQSDEAGSLTVLPLHSEYFQDSPDASAPRLPPHRHLGDKLPWLPGEGHTVHTNST